MKLVTSAAVAMLLASPLAAQTTPAPATTPVPSAAATAPKFTLDTPIETIAADPVAKAALDADLPGVTTHPMYEQFKSMSLNQVQPMSQGQITDAALAKLKVDLAALK